MDGASLNLYSFGPLARGQGVFRNMNKKFDTVQLASSLDVAV